MTSLPLVRTEYHDSGDSGTVRGGATSHGESLVDVESYLMRHDQVSSSALHSWGVADGLSTMVAPDPTSLTVMPGVALDSSGHLISLAVGGSAITSRDVAPGQVANVPIVPVTVGGVVLVTTGLTGDRYLTITWREARDSSTAGNAPTLMHTPWLRLQPVADVSDTGEQVILAHVVLNAQSEIAALTADHRRVVGLPAGRVELRRARSSAGPPTTVDQVAAGEIRATDSGGLGLNLLTPSGSVRPVLEADPAGNLGLLPGGGGSAGIGLPGAAARRTVHIEGTEVHSGGPSGGFSFASRTVGSFVDSPTAGERWVWFATGDTARLWSGTDRLTIGANAGGQRLQVGAAGAPLELSATGGSIGKLALTANTIAARRADGTEPVVVDTVNGRIGQGTATPTHPLHVTGTSGIRQNSMYVSGGVGWSSLSYNAHHNDTNSGWGFPDPTRPSVTLEMDDNSSFGPRFEVYTTTNDNKQGWQLRLGIDGNTGRVRIPGEVAVGSIASLSSGTLAVQSSGGSVGVGLQGAAARRALHVEGSEIHSGGPGGGFSFSNRTTGTFVENPTDGERWVWYASAGAARLWSGTDRLTIGSNADGQRLQVGAAGSPVELSANGGSIGTLALTANAVTIPGNLTVSSAGIFTSGLSVDGAADGSAVVASASPGHAAITASGNAGEYAMVVIGTSLGMWVEATRAANFIGDVVVIGTFVATDKRFVIDHPLDPENRTLTHACVESSERAVVYSGNATCEDDGTAIVTLPGWLEALATDFRYQLTCVGGQSTVYISERMRDNAFTIAGGDAGLVVSWQVTGVRQDAWAKTHDMVVEEDKPKAERGHFLNPEAFGRDMTASVHWVQREDRRKADAAATSGAAKKRTREESSPS